MRAAIVFLWVLVQGCDLGSSEHQGSHLGASLYPSCGLLCKGESQRIRVRIEGRAKRWRVCASATYLWVLVCGGDFCPPAHQGTRLGAPLYLPVFSCVTA